MNTSACRPTSIAGRRTCSLLGLGEAGREAADVARRCRPASNGGDLRREGVPPAEAVGGAACLGDHVHERLAEEEHLLDELVLEERRHIAGREAEADAEVTADPLLPSAVA